MFSGSLFGADDMFSRAWHGFHVLQRLALWVFSLVTFFPPLAPVMCFPALGNSYKISCACYLNYLPPFSLVTCLTTLNIMKTTSSTVI